MRDWALPTAFVLVLALASTPLPAQETAPGVEAQVVRLDVVVRGPDGDLAGNLTREDFEVLEDGKPQRITHFLVVGSSRATVEAGAALESLEPSPAYTAAGPGRQIVIVFDDLHVTESSLPYARNALKQFVDELIGEDDRVALLTTSTDGVLQQLTSDRAALLQAIDRLTSRDVGVGRGSGAMMSAGEAELVMQGQFNAIQLVGSTLMSEQGGGGVLPPTGPRAAVEGATNPSQTGPGSVASTASLNQRRFYERESRRLAAPILAEALHFSSATLGSVEQVVRQLSSLPGRKICLLVSDGFLIGRGTDQDRLRDLQQVIDAATRSGAVVYVLDSRGLAGGEWQHAGIRAVDAPPGLQQSVSGQVQQNLRETLANLAGGTGGFLVRGSNDLASGLRRMLDDNETYYLLAYEPSNTNRDGRFRRIEVRLAAHPDLEVRTRSGYYAPDENEPERRPAPAFRLLDETEARQILAALPPSDGVPVRLAAAFVDLPPVGSQAIVAAHVDLARMEWETRQGRHHASLELMGGLYDAEGQPVGSAFGRRADLDLSREEHERAAASGLDFQQSMPLGPGRYEVRLLALDAERHPLGGASEWIDIPDLAESTLTLSSVFLSSSPHRDDGSAPDAAEEGEVLRAAPTRRRFERGDTLYFQVYVYNPLVDEKGERDVVLQAQLRAQDQLIAASKPLPVEFQERNGVPLPETNGMPLEGLAPGRYDLRLVVVDRKADVTAFRDIEFELE